MKNLFLVLIICGLIFSFVSGINMRTLTPSEAGASDLTMRKSIDKRAIKGPILRGDETIPTGQSEEPSVLSKALTSPGDTVGGTTYDWFVNGPGTRRIYYDPSYGTIHLTWMHSRDCADFPDRHMVYNYWDGSDWAYNNPDFMESGYEEVNPLKDGYGTLDVDNSTGIEFICMHASEGDVYYSWVCYDIIPGGAFFNCSHCPTPIGICDEGIIWPRLALGPSGYVHICAVAYIDINDIYYCNSSDGGNTFSPWVFIATNGFPTHNIAASQNSPKVCIVWSVSDGDDDGVVYYKESTDGGTTWGDSVDISSDIPSDLRHAWIIGGFPFYDSDDNLHIATQTADGENIAPAEVWHWCEANSPEWSLVASYPELWELAGTPGFNALCQDRPTIGMDPTTGYVYCVWEEFPWDDEEPVTGRANAEIYAARSMDNGDTWGNKVNLTNTFGEHERYPSLAPVVNSTLHIEYLADLMAGHFIQAEGECTDNPVLYLSVPVIEGDVAAISIDNPTPVAGETCYPKATVANNGSNEVTFQARLSAVIKGMEFYYDIEEVTLGGGASVQVEFEPWLVDSAVYDTVIFEGQPPDTVVLDTIIVCCYASLLGDTDLSNDIFCIPFEGVQEIPTDGELPKVFALSQNYPNPFNPITSIEYTVPKGSEVSLKIYNVLGQEVNTLVNQSQKRGAYRATWNGEDSEGQRVTSGIYFYQLKAEGISLMRKMILLK